ncbi:MAG: trigger factor [Bacteroidales bacterium]|nr:trigger factor [Bacteroidales bacterium]MDD5911057.1 trigger factor [Bacteroidales bacterium]
MNIEQNRIDDLNLELTLSVVKEDYADKKVAKLKEHRKHAEIKGFRKGMVPMSLIEKMYGQASLVDAVNDVISSALNDFIKENNLNVVGEPLPAEDQPQTEWVDGNDFTFKFDIAQNPQINLELSKDDKIPYYNIEVSEAARDEMKQNMLKQYGSLEEGEAAKEDDFIIVDFVQGETRVEGAYVALRSISEAVKPSFVGLKAGDSIDVNVNEAFENETDRASMLKVKKEELANLDPMFKMTVNNVKTFVNAPVNQETFDKIFGEGNVKSEEEFDAKVAERLAFEYSNESNWRFSKDAKDYILAKAGLEVPEKFLKRWIYVINEGKFTMEDIEKDWALFIVDYKWQMIRTYLMQKYNVKIEEKDILASAKGFAAYQFAMYGMNNVPDEQLESFAKNILAQEDQSRRIYDQVENEKTIAAVREAVSLDVKPISVEAFRELK